MNQIVAGISDPVRIQYDSESIHRLTGTRYMYSNSMRQMNMLAELCGLRTIGSRQIPLVFICPQSAPAFPPGTEWGQVLNSPSFPNVRTTHSSAASTEVFLSTDSHSETDCPQVAPVDVVGALDSAVLESIAISARAPQPLAFNRECLRVCIGIPYCPNPCISRA